MNQDRDNKLPGDESDPMVSAQYRATATERTPPTLDELVLAKAKAATKGSGLRGFTARWFRPLAFVATLGLSLAILLELTSNPDLRSVESPEPDTGRLEVESTVADPIAGANGISDAVRRSYDSPAGKDESVEPDAYPQLISPNKETGRQQRLESAPSAANAPLSDVDTSADFADMIDASSKQMQAQENVAETATQGVKRSDQKTRVEELGSFRTSGYMLKEAARPCTEAQIADPETWWQCISELEEAGRHDEAKAELELFNTTHPDFDVPEILPSQ